MSNGQVALKGGSRDQGIDIADQAIGWPQRSPDSAVATHDRVRHEERRDFLEEIDDSTDRRLDGQRHW